MYYFIVNPKSGSGKGLKIWNTLESRLKNEKIPYQVFLTHKKGDSEAFAAEISSHHTPCILTAVGGDGTANEVLNGLQSFEGITFSYIPVGSSNDLARGLGLPADPSGMLDCILKPSRTIAMNVGCCHADGETKRFLVSSGIGYDAAVCHQALNSRLKNVLNRIRLGKLTYLGIALQQLIRLKPFPMNLTLDQDQALTFQGIFFAAFMNLPYEGGGFRFCPKAAPDDGFLDICLVERMPRLKVLFLLPTAFKGRHTLFRGIHIYRCRNVTLNLPSPMAIHTDGESFAFRSGMEVSLEPSSLPFIVG
ncbi:MAG: diacylglycerol kinase family lipid kinase [Candidatus Limivivens sp.]|nr:diacylglycerol kinase family lipid kinase [Candidatus Limivivens sp.]